MSANDLTDAHKGYKREVNVFRPFKLDALFTRVALY